MIKKQAIELAKEKLKLLFKKTEVTITGVEEFEFGWVVHYQSKEYVEKGGFTMLIGAGPLIVDKDTSLVYKASVHLESVWDFIKYKKGKKANDDWSIKVV